MRPSWPAKLDQAESFDRILWSDAPSRVWHPGPPLPMPLAGSPPPPSIDSGVVLATRLLEGIGALASSQGGRLGLLQPAPVHSPLKTVNWSRAFPGGPTPAWTSFGTFSRPTPGGGDGFLTPAVLRAPAEG